MQPSTCPLCRKAFLPDRAKKLHIDRPMEHDDSARVNEFLQRLDSASSESTPEEVAQSLNEVRQWLATRDDGNHIVVCHSSFHQISVFNDVALRLTSMTLV